MARHRHGISDPVVKKGGFLGKFVAFLLGFIIGIGAIAGAVFGVVSYVMSNTLHNTVSLLDSFAPGLYAVMFGVDGHNNGVLDKDYANKTVNDLLGNSMDAVSKIQNGDGSIQALSDIFPIVGNFVAPNPSTPYEKSPVTGLQFPPLNPVTYIPLPHSFKISFKDTPFSVLLKQSSFIKDVMHGRDISSTVGSISILFAIYVLTKYCLITPFSMIALSLVATPSVSYILEPAFPGVLARSINVMPSEKTFLFKLPSRNDIFCWIDEALRAVRIGDTRRDAVLLSTTMRYLPPFLFFGPIWDVALSKAVLLIVSMLNLS